jgi:hypothetical protein
MGLVAFAVLLTAAIVHGTGPPFTFRLGQVPTRKLHVSVPSFQVNNQRKTLAAIQRASDAILPIMDNDPAPIRALAQRLVDLTDAISRSADRDSLPEGIRQDWNISQTAFDELRAATDTP